MTADEIKKAMHEFKPVRYNGILYKRITAYIYRAVPVPMTNNFRGVLQVELLDRGGNSVTIADADRVEAVENYGI
mgnify:CR=1 FL=1